MFIGKFCRYRKIKIISRRFYAADLKYYRLLLIQHLNKINNPLFLDMFGNQKLKLLQVVLSNFLKVFLLLQTTIFVVTINY